MSAGKYNLTIEQGATFQLALVVGNSDGSPRDLTGYAARMQVRTSYAAAAAVVDLNTTNGGITIDVPSSRLTLRMEAAATAGLTPLTGVYDVELQAPDGTVYRLIQGVAHITAEVTR